MPVMIEKTAKTVQAAINEALAELGKSEADVVIEVLDEGDSGVLGIGRKPARVLVSYEEELVPSESLEPEDLDVNYYGDAENDDEDDVSSGSQEEDLTVNYVAAVLSGIGIHGKISSYQEDETIYVDVTGPDCGAAIGYRGKTLEAIQYLASLAVNQNKDKYLRVVVDIAGYRKRREKTLINLAERTARKVTDSGRKIRLEPMNPAERRIIHSALQPFPGVVTFSEGEEPKRNVVIAPGDEMNN